MQVVNFINAKKFFLSAKLIFIKKKKKELLNNIFKN